MTNPDFDPLSAFTIVLSLLLGPQLAPLASAYTIIFIGAFAGVLIGLRKRETTSRIGAASFCFIGMSLAIFTAVPLSNLVGSHLPGGGGTWLFFPVALLIAAYHGVWLTKIRDLGVRLIDSFGSKNAN